MNNSPTDRGRYRFECALDCGKKWSGDDLARIAKNVAWHWNEKHNDELRHGSKKQIDEIERGGHHLHGNEYSVERIPIYLTSFDVMEQIGLEDGYAVLDDSADVCVDCMEVISNTDHAVEADEGYSWETLWVCSDCQQERDLEQRRETNESLEAFSA